MAFNYANLAENMLPLYGTMPNGVSMPNHPGFLNQLAAAINAVGGNMSTTTTTTNALSATKPETNILQKLNLTPPKMKPNQGTAPMDLENDSEQEHTSTLATTTALSLSKTTASAAVDKLQPTITMSETNMYLNGLMPTPGYMFFPTAAGNATTANASAAATSSTQQASLLMDPSAMMAAAMQQMQQSYAGYAALSAEPANVDGNAIGTGADAYNAGTPLAQGTNAGNNAVGIKEVIKTKSCILFPPNPNAPPPTIRERPPGCRTVFVGGLPENISEDVIREIFESCGEITTLRMSKKNFCHIRYRHETSIDRAIYLSGYRVRISNLNEPPNFGRLHVDYAQARDDQYEYECKQRQLQREQRHRERMSIDRLRSQSPPPIAHYTEHEASVVAEHLRNNDTFVKAIQTITTWLERGDCTKRNANVFYSMIQSTHAHVRRLHADKQQLEDDLRKARESYRKQMLTMCTQFTQIEKVFNAASHKKVWDHFTKAQRKNIDQWKKLATELRTVQIDDDEMEISDDDRDYPSRHTAKRSRYDNESLKDENDALRCQLEAIRNEMSMERTDLRYDSVQREKQIKVLQETIRNMQTQLLQTKMREQKDAKTIEQLERSLKEAGVQSSRSKTVEINEICIEDDDVDEPSAQFECSNKQQRKEHRMQEIIDIDVYRDDDDVRIIEHQSGVVEIHEIEDDEKAESKEVAELNVRTSSNSETSKIETADSLPHAESVFGTRRVKPVVVADQTIAENDVKLAAESQALVAHEQIVCEVLTTNVKAPAELEFKSLALAEAKIIALTAAYLVLHPHGVSVVSISGYLRELISSSAMQLETSYLEEILRKYTNLFKAETDNKDMTIARQNSLNAAAGDASESNATNTKWSFCGFIESTDQLLDEK